MKPEELTWKQMAKLVSQEIPMVTVEEAGGFQGVVEQSLRGFKRLTDIDPGGRGLDIINRWHELDPEGK